VCAPLVLEEGVDCGLMRGGRATFVPETFEGAACARRWGLRRVFDCRWDARGPRYVRAKNLKWSNGDT
jgi:hypothetical protein